MFSRFAGIGVGHTTLESDGDTPGLVTEPHDDDDDGNNPEIQEVGTQTLCESCDVGDGVEWGNDGDETDNNDDQDNNEAEGDGDSDNEDDSEDDDEDDNEDDDEGSDGEEGEI
ncbi:hypothetical protein HD554DRAFT_2043014 [Boletus coccyginus]|nr:hypothetical protein HD554DRAFT_2043014 [Boletus coccyginus]